MLDDVRDARPRETLVQLDVAQREQVAGRASRHEDRAPVRQAPHPIAPRRDPLDADRLS
jgi:hypothetical protein